MAAGSRRRRHVPALGHREVGGPGITRPASFIRRIGLEGECIAHLGVKLSRVTVDCSNLSGVLPSLSASVHKVPQDLFDVRRAGNL